MEDQSTFNLFAEHDPKYYQALGEFVETFAGIEATLHVTLWHYARTPANIARAVFSGVRVNNAIDNINRILTVTEQTDKTRGNLEYVFAQIKIINDARNQIIHYGTIPSENAFVGRLSTNALRALSKDRITTLAVSAETLANMTYDLRKIQMHLYMNHLRGAYDPSKPFLEFAQLVLNAAWRYIPPPQERHRNKNRENAPKQPRPRGSSRA